MDFSRNNFPLRPQTVSGVPLQIRDASQYYTERVSHHAPDLKVIDYAGLFEKDELVIGIGKPNVFLLLPDGTGEHLRFAAKSLWRAPHVIEETKGRVQSSIFFILKNLGEETLERVLSHAQSVVGEKEATCVHANAKVLAASGFTLGNGEHIDSYFFTVPFFRAIAQHGLIAGNSMVDAEILKTTPLYLERQIFETNKATWMTPIRHAQRFFPKRSVSQDIPTPQNTPAASNTKNFYVMPDEPEHVRDFTLDVSLPSKLVTPLRITWGPHTIFKISQDRVDINAFLPEELQAYPQENPSLMTRLKRDILFNRFVVGGINTMLQKQFVSFSGKSEANLHALFEISTDENPIKYNIVSSLSGTMLMKNDIQNPTVDWILTKHVLISNYNESVRFAGEIWKDKNGVIWVNRNSGTYQPSEEQLQKFVAYLSEVFPHVTFQADTKI